MEKKSSFSIVFQELIGYMHNREPVGVKELFAVSLDYDLVLIYIIFFFRRYWYSSSNKIFADYLEKNGIQYFWNNFFDNSDEDSHHPCHGDFKLALGTLW